MENLGVDHKMVQVNGINIHYAEKGQGPVILFLHGFPELWYSWRHQITAFAALRYRAIAPDLRGFGDSDVPPAIESYTCFHIVGDLVGLLDAVTTNQEKVFVVGHDWGAIIAWYLCLFRPDRVKALCNLSVPYFRRNPNTRTVDAWRAYYGDDYYISRYQEDGVIECEFAELGTETVLRETLTYKVPGPFMSPKGKLFGHPPRSSSAIDLPSWLSEEDVKYYISKFEKTGFTGGLNLYRNLNKNWELLAPWQGGEVKVPAKFVVGDIDPVYHMPGMKDYIHNGGLKTDVPLLEEVVVLEGVGHFCQQEKPEDITNHIYDYFHKMIL